jgi:hypothetical protein
MFKVDRASAIAKPFPAAGKYEVSVVKVEEAITTKGEDQVILTLRNEDGCVVSDRFLNRESVYWRVNALLAATNLEIPEGTEIDFSKRGQFGEFLSRFVGEKVGIQLEEESYFKEGETKTVLKVKRYNKVQGEPVPKPF